MPRLLDAGRPVAFFANGTGDHLLNLPALRALADLFKGRLRLICMEGSRAAFFGDLPLDDAIEAHMWSEGGTRHFDAPTLARQIGACDLLLSLNPWHSSSVDRLLAELAPAFSIGFFPVYDEMLPRDYSKHSAELAFDVPLRIAAGINVESFSAEPLWPLEVRQAAAAIRAEIPARMRVLAVHADTKADKMWPADRWRELFERLLTRRRNLIVLVLGREQLGLDVCSDGERVIPCMGLPLTVSLALVGLTDIFIGIDSCVLHAADLARVPGVGLFGPTNPAEFGFRFAPHRHVSGVGDMGAITVDMVEAAFEHLWAATRARPASCETVEAS